MPEKASTTILLIVGMRANACRESVAAALEKVPGVREVDVNLHRARAVVVHDPACDPATLVQAVASVGHGAMIAPRP